MSEQAPFPWHVWAVAIRDTIRWFLNYQPPPSEAVSAQVYVYPEGKKPQDQEGENG
jgi:hypothetical protein